MIVQITTKRNVQLMAVMVLALGAILALYQFVFANALLRAKMPSNAPAGVVYEDVFLSHQPTWMLEGDNPYDAVGSVKPAGDVNGDGYADAIVSRYVTGQSDSGTYHNLLFLGSADGLGATAVMSTTDVSLYQAGDVNGDRYADLFSVNEGVLELYAGSPTGISLTPAGQLNGLLDVVGQVAVAGDVNKDGHDDLIVGAGGNSEVAQYAGKIAIYLGSDSGYIATPIFEDWGTAASDGLGVSVSAAGDINKDGYADVIAGATQQGASYHGYVKVYFGSANGINAAETQTLPHQADQEYFGRTVSDAGDVNNDGYDDIVVTGYNADLADGTQSAGKVYIFHGQSSGINPTPATTISGTDAYEAFGYVVAGAGDANGDGYDDVMVGHPYADMVSNFEGLGDVYIYPGSPSGILSTPAFVGKGEPYGAQDYGRYVAGVGDVNGDGRDDIMVGALRTNNLRGRAYLYSGHLEVDNPMPSLTLQGIEEGEKFGEVLETADVNGDGYMDLIAAAPDANRTAGRFDVYFGSAVGLNPTPGFSVVDDCDPSRLGEALKNAGDIDKDGTDDLLLYALNDDGCYDGKAIIYYGAQNGELRREFLTISTERYISNVRVMPAGDVNKDGYADVIITDTGYRVGDLVAVGRVYIHHGSSSGLTAIPARTLTGTRQWQALGITAVGAGDLNKDGYDDILIGFNDENGDGVQVYLGNATGIGAAPAKTIVNQAAGFNANLIPIGDHNGDGYDDVLIAAPLVDGEHMQNVGQLFLYYGNASGLASSPAAVLTGEYYDDYLGRYAQPVGDVNGDGIPDILLGFSGFNMRAANAGRAELYMGTPTGFAPADRFIVTGTAVSDSIGRGMAAGDVNNDGVIDIFLGVLEATGADNVAHAGNVLGYMHFSFNSLADNLIFLPFIQK